MAVITIPYEFKNGQPESGDIAIDNTNGPLCGEKYYELRPIRVSSIQNGMTTSQCVFFTYLGDEYGVYSITPDEFIQLTAECFTCPGGTDCDCNEQECLFNWRITANQADGFSSTTIVKDVGTGNFIYTMDLTVNATPYATGVTIWDDSLALSAASDSVKDYFDAIISQIESYSIPEYRSSWNKALNGMADNKEGVDMLELFFDVGTTLTFTIYANAVSIGTVGAASTQYISADIEFTDMSTLNVTDTITQYTWQVWDGENIMVSTDGNNPTTPVWSIQSCNYLNPNNGWVMSLCIATENGCVFNNVATAIISSDDIIDCITIGATKSGSGI